MSEDLAFEIYLTDLTEKAQKEFLEFMGLPSAEEGNYDVFPIAQVYKLDKIFGE
jgi:hypothetical protein